MMFDDFQDFDQDKTSKVQPTSPLQANPESEIKANPENANLFTVLDRGDKIIQKSRPQAIILVGLTRKGKSTTFNWMLQSSMVGCTKKEGEEPYYVNSVEGNKDSAKVGNNYASVTLAPNLHADFPTKKLGPNGIIQEVVVSLLDMAGYEDTRNYVGVIGVSYFLKEVFERVKKAKFIIVLTQKMFEDTSGQGIILTLTGFLSMFNYAQLKSKQVRLQIRKSVMVVVTKAKLSQTHHYNKLKLVLDKIKEPYFKLQKKEAYVEFLSWLLRTERIQTFKAAVVGKAPEQCTFIDKHSTNVKDPWEFFDLKQAEKMLNRSPIDLPFKKDFQKLKDNQVNEFISVIDMRVKAFEGFATILAQLVTTYNKNWNDFVKAFKTKQTTELFFLKMGSIFEKIKAYNEVNDSYAQSSLKEFQLKVTIEPLNFIQSILAILKIHERIEQITSNLENSFEINMNILAKEYAGLVQLLKVFATKNEDYQALHRLNYILMRGFKEFKRLFQLRDSCIIDANQKLRDFFVLTKQLDNKSQFIEGIVKQINKQLMLRLFPTLNLIELYEDFFSTYENNSSCALDSYFLKAHKQSIEEIKAGYYLTAGKKSQALLSYIKMFFILQEIGGLKNNSSTDSQQQKRAFLDQLSMQKIAVIRRIVEILKVLPKKQIFSPIDEALRLCQHVKMMEDTCQLYQMIIDSPSTSHQQKLQRYLNYAQYSASWGDIDLAIRLLKKRLKLEEKDHSSYMGTVQLIKRFNNQRAYYYKQFNNHLASITVLPVVDSGLNSILEQIQYFVKTA